MIWGTTDDAGTLYVIHPKDMQEWGLLTLRDCAGRLSRLMGRPAGKAYPRTSTK